MCLPPILPETAGLGLEVLTGPEEEICSGKMQRHFNFLKSKI